MKKQDQEKFGEFLTSYGWAILILIIVIVALANLGVFKVSYDEDKHECLEWECEYTNIKGTKSGGTCPLGPPLGDLISEKCLDWKDKE